MAIQLAGILGAIDVVKGISNIFKKKQKPTEILDNALTTIQSALGDAKDDPEAMKLIQDHELELEREYTKRAQAGLDVIKAEAQSEDPWVRRARPMWLYMGMIIFFVQMVIFPFCKIRITEFIAPEALNWFYTIIGSGYLGYGALRTYDKKSGGTGSPTDTDPVKAAIRKLGGK